MTLWRYSEVFVYGITAQQGMLRDTNTIGTGYQAEVSWLRARRRRVFDIVLFSLLVSEVTC
jgi:hypothetical protein